MGRTRNRNSSRSKYLRRKHYGGRAAGRTEHLRQTLRAASHSKDDGSNRKKEKKQIVVVSRHRALLDYLQEDAGIDFDNVELIHHASRKSVRGKDVIGNPPLYIAEQAKTVTNFSVRIPEDLRGTGLTLEQIRLYIQPPKSYIIQRIPIPQIILDEIDSRTTS